MCNYKNQTTVTIQISNNKQLKSKQMQIEIRLSESGHPYHYAQLTTVHSLMQEIRKDFKIEVQDQKLILRNGQTLKSSMAFESINDQMSKTISANLNNGSQISKISSLYVYNQKELLRPIDFKPKYGQDETYIKILDDKTQEMSTLADSSYQIKQFFSNFDVNLISTNLNIINKKTKNSIINIEERYANFVNSLQKISHYKLQICSLLELIQNQDKARKLLIRNIEYLYENKGKAKLKSLNEKIKRQQKSTAEISLKDNSQFFSGKKSTELQEEVLKMISGQEQIEASLKKFNHRLKEEKREISQKRYIEESKVTIQFDSKVNSREDSFLSKEGEGLFGDLISEILAWNDKKDAKNISKVNDQLISVEQKIEELKEELKQMFVKLSKIHANGEYRHIKEVFAVYVQLIKSWDEIDVRIKKLEKALYCFRQETQNRQVEISEFYESKGKNMPLKAIIKSPKKRMRTKSPASESKEKENSIPKINSPIKNKICKNELRALEDIKANGDNKSSQPSEEAQCDSEVLRRLYFNRRLKFLFSYIEQICKKQEHIRNQYCDQKNAVKCLENRSVPSVQINFEGTTDLEACQLYKDFEKAEKQRRTVDWQSELVESLNTVNRTLTAYLAKQSNPTEKQQCLEKILSILSESFYTVMKKKLAKELSKNKKSEKEIESLYSQKIKSLNKQNLGLKERVEKLEEELESQKVSMSVRMSESICRIEEIERKEDQLSNINRELQEENSSLSQKNEDLQNNLNVYQNDIEQITEKLTAIEQEHLEETEALKKQFQSERDEVKKLKAQKDDLSAKLQKAKKNLLGQMDQNDILCKELTELVNEKQFCQAQFFELKQILADREVEIIRLEKALQGMKSQGACTNENELTGNVIEGQKQTFLPKSSENELQFGDSGAVAAEDLKMVPIELQEEFLGEKPTLDEPKAQKSECSCSCYTELQELKSQNEELQNQVEDLNKELRDILFKSTSTEEIETQTEVIGPISGLQKQKSDLNCEIEEMTLKNNNMPEQLPKQHTLQNSGVGHSGGTSIHQAQSQYYMPGNRIKNWSSAAFNFDNVSIGKTIEEGQLHLFVPFSEDVYVGVNTQPTAERSGVTNYEELWSQTENNPTDCKKSVYVLDLKSFSEMTAELLQESQLVLVVRVTKLRESLNSDKVMVSGVLEYAVGFEQDNMELVNYVPLLSEG